jgi:hypothetical protein
MTLPHPALTCNFVCTYIKDKNGIEDLLQNANAYPQASVETNTTTDHVFVVLTCKQYLTPMILEHPKLVGGMEGIWRKRESMGFVSHISVSPALTEGPLAVQIVCLKPLLLLSPTI